MKILAFPQNTSCLLAPVNKVNQAGFPRDKEGKRRLPLGFSIHGVGNIGVMPRRPKSSVEKKMKHEGETLLDIFETNLQFKYTFL